MDRGKLVIMCYHMNILQLDKKPTGKDPIIRLGLKIGNTHIQVIQSASPILYTDLNIFREFFKKPHSDFRKACFKKKVLPIHFRFICFSCIQLPLHRSIIWKTFPNFKNFNNLPQVCTHHWCSWQYNLSLYFMSSYVQDFTDAGYGMWSQQQIHQMLKPRQTWETKRSSLQHQANGRHDHRYKIEISPSISSVRSSSPTLTFCHQSPPKYTVGHYKLHTN